MEKETTDMNPSMTADAAQPDMNATPACDSMNQMSQMALQEDMAQSVASDECGADDMAPNPEAQPSVMKQEDCEAPMPSECADSGMMADTEQPG